MYMTFILSIRIFDSFKSLSSNLIPGSEHPADTLGELMIAGNSVEDPNAVQYDNHKRTQSIVQTTIVARAQAATRMN